MKSTERSQRALALEDRFAARRYWYFPTQIWFSQAMDLSCAQS